MKIIFVLLFISTIVLNLSTSHAGEGESVILKSKKVKFNINKPWDQIIEEKMNMCAEQVRHVGTRNFAVRNTAANTCRHIRNHALRKIARS
jgi:predicted lipase